MNKAHINKLGKIYLIEKNTQVCLVVFALLLSFLSEARCEPFALVIRPYVSCTDNKTCEEYKHCGSACFCNTDRRWGFGHPFKKCWLSAAKR